MGVDENNFGALMLKLQSSPTFEEGLVSIALAKVFLIVLWYFHR